MTSSVTHFEIYGEEPAALADFYREALGWNIEQMPV
jgi:predicted enzyme related to lactoylglutathione lyase